MGLADGVLAIRLPDSPGASRGVEAKAQGKARRASHTEIRGDVDDRRALRNCQVDLCSAADGGRRQALHRTASVHAHVDEGGVQTLRRAIDDAANAGHRRMVGDVASGQPATATTVA